MAGFLLRRIGQSALVLAIMSFVIYGLIGLMPGDPIDLMLSANPRLTAADAEALRAVYGLDKPLLSRYLAWAEAALRLDFGYSRLQQRPVLEVLAGALGQTAWLMISSFVLGTVVALTLALAAAHAPGSRLDRIVGMVAFAGLSVPTFWLALMLILVFAVTLGWLPAGGVADASAIHDAGFWDAAWANLRYLILPIATLAIYQMGGLTRYARAALLETIAQDYVRTARAKGATERRILLTHILPNAAVPIVTVLALDFGGLFSGALVTEIMFAQTGMGRMIYDAIQGNDFNLALVGLLFATAVTLAANLVADVAYAAIDPRIALE
jgi:peptide/nickel transport system permease protein